MQAAVLKLKATQAVVSKLSVDVREKVAAKKKERAASKEAKNASATGAAASVTAADEGAGSSGEGIRKIHAINQAALRSARKLRASLSKKGRGGSNDARSATESTSSEHHASDHSEVVVPKLGLSAAQGQSEAASQVAAAAATPAPSPQGNTPRYAAPPAAAEAVGGVAVGTPRYDTEGKASAATKPPSGMPPASPQVGTPRYGDTPEGGGGGVGQYEAGLGTLPAGGWGRTAGGTPGTPRYGATAAALGGASGEGVSVGDVHAELVEPAEEAAEERGDIQLAEALEARVDAQLGVGRTSLQRRAALGACSWLVTQQMRKGSDAAAPTLPAAIAQAIATDPAPPDFGRELPAVEQAACERRWRFRHRALKAEVEAAAGAAAAEQAARPWADKLLEAELLVIEPNMPQLSEHLVAMRTEHLEQASRDLSRMPPNVQASSLKGKAASVKRVLDAALDDVERQFNEGMLAVAKPLLATQPELQAEPALVPQLVAGLVAAHRTLVEAEHASTALMEAQLDEMVASGAATASAKEGHAKSGYAFLHSCVLGNHALAMPAEQYDFLCNQVAVYLDPFLDGEVPRDQYHARCAGSFMARLATAWKLRHADESLPGSISPELALTQYTRHLVCKCNMQLGFGLHFPGLGRQPISPKDQEVHAGKLSAAVIDAVRRDFAPDQRRLSPELAELTPQLLQDVAREHLRCLFLHQSELGSALAIANRDGEEARRQERLRIWGYC